MKEAFSNPYRYAGYYQDSESNLYYLQSGYYNARIARFLSEDTASGKYTDPLSLNKYTYCHNQPVTAYDPEGHFGVLAAAGLTILGAAVVSGGVSAYFQHKNTGSVDLKRLREMLLRPLTLLLELLLLRHMALQEQKHCLRLWARVLWLLPMVAA